jgi:peptidyl-prolyl cis-trans isomerase-like protein 2
MARLPFFCCSLSLQPFNSPVCSPEGIIFDIVSIIPFLKKYGKNPVNSLPLKISELIKLNFHKNEKDEFHDPISFKTFTDFTFIVAIKTSGNVYSNETLEELNRKPKYWKDLMTDEPFTHKDILILQNPHEIYFRTIQNFDFLKQKIDFVSLLKEEKSTENVNKS